MDESEKKDSEAAWYREVELEADPPLARASAKAGNLSASSRDQVGDISSMVRAAHQRLEVPEPKQVWDDGFWRSIFQPASDPLKDFLVERFDRPAQPSGSSLDTGSGHSEPEHAWRPLVGSSFLQAVKNRDPVS